RSPARGKPARHNCAICLDLGVAAKLCRYRCSDKDSRHKRISAHHPEIISDFPLKKSPQPF
ncbi:hypothetical protein, partial [Pseudomonas proteolytica]|uniref:hypothetical protein n=1 Tax=Pseudomonas proteolytica TaxID=219574 RepID=UPI001CA45891